MKEKLIELPFGEKFKEYWLTFELALKFTCQDLSKVNMNDILNRITNYCKEESESIKYISRLIYIVMLNNTKKYFQFK
jgi:hypothetical protein